MPQAAVGVAYTATLTASGGKSPYSWKITSGTLPAGLSLDATTGTISGTASAAASSTLTIQVQDSSSPAQTASGNFSLSVVAVTVSASPANAAITTSQSVSLTATTPDGAGVTWSATPSGGTFSATTSLSGVAVKFSATQPGAYTIKATSVSDTSKSAQVFVGVTDLTGVFTYHDDLARDGANTHEYALTPQNVASSFGKLFSCAVDGAIYAQPLWVANVKINGGAAHNVVFVATAHDSLYAFDADASPCATLWHANLLDKAHGGTVKMDGTTPDESPVPAGASTSTPAPLVGLGDGNMAPEVGVTGTPVIDPATGTLYVVSKSVASDNKTFFQRLHAIDITSGNEKGKSPVAIAATYPGTGDGTTTDTFNLQTQNQRPALALVPGTNGAAGTVYVAWASHEDAGHFYGWIIGYTFDGTSFTQSAVLNIAPNAPGPGHGGGIWMSGGAPAVDSSGNLYLITGNGPFDATSTTAPNNDYGDSLLKLAVTGGKLAVGDYFTPSDQALDDSGDNDFGAGGATILADLPAPVQINGTAVSHLVIGGDENGTLYLLNRDKLGGYTSNNAGVVQQLTSGTELTGGANNGVIYATGAFWNGYFYILANGQTPQLQAYQLNTSTAQLAMKSSVKGFGFPSGTPSISAQGTANGILWALDDSQYCTPESPGCAAAVLHAYDATDLSKELWNSAKVAGDVAGYPVKFTVPTVANGRVYVGTRGNNTGGAYNSTSTNGELDVYGLK